MSSKNKRGGCKHCCCCCCRGPTGPTGVQGGAGPTGPTGPTGLFEGSGSMASRAFGSFFFTGPLNLLTLTGVSGYLNSTQISIQVDDSTPQLPSDTKISLVVDGITAADVTLGAWMWNNSRWVTGVALDSSTIQLFRTSVNLTTSLSWKSYRKCYVPFTSSVVVSVDAPTLGMSTFGTVEYFLGVPSSILSGGGTRSQWRALEFTSTMPDGVTSTMAAVPGSLQVETVYCALTNSDPLSKFGSLFYVKSPDNFAYPQIEMGFGGWAVDPTGYASFGSEKWGIVNRNTLSGNLYWSGYRFFDVIEDPFVAPSGFSLEATVDTTTGVSTSSNVLVTYWI